MVLEACCWDRRPDLNIHAVHGDGLKATIGHPLRRLDRRSPRRRTLDDRHADRLRALRQMTRHADGLAAPE
jgi:hypothetical protein